MVNLIVDGKEIKASEGANLLRVCLDNEIYVPNLCYLKEMEHPPASCRLCFVAIEGYPQPVTSCTEVVREGMVVMTDTPEVRRLQKSAFELLLSVRRISFCKTCIANKRCGLQKIARFLGVKLRVAHLNRIDVDREVDHTHPYLDYDPDKCVLCERCIFVCGNINKTPMLSLAHRGLNTSVTFFESAAILENSCKGCGACVEICPVGALTLKSHNKVTG
nr:(4Fe-4S)-binding protein [Desulfobacterales bacterium]